MGVNIVRVLVLVSEPEGFLAGFGAEVVEDGMFKAGGVL